MSSKGPRLTDYAKGTADARATATALVPCADCQGRACEACHGEGSSQLHLVGDDAIRAALRSGDTTLADEVESLGLGFEAKELRVQAPGSLRVAWATVEGIVRFCLVRRVPFGDVAAVRDVLRDALDAQEAEEGLGLRAQLDALRSDPKVMQARQQLAALVTRRGGVMDVDQAAE